jgi:hypothetical protein
LQTKLQPVAQVRRFVPGTVVVVVVVIIREREKGEREKWGER